MHGRMSNQIQYLARFDSVRFLESILQVYFEVLLRFLNRKMSSDRE